MDEKLSGSKDQKHKNYPGNGLSVEVATLRTELLQMKEMIMSLTHTHP